MKCTFLIWEPDGNGCAIYRLITVYKPSFELAYEFRGYKFKFDCFLNTSYQHAYYLEG
jgi:hypothetical protein